MLSLTNGIRMAHEPSIRRLNEDVPTTLAVVFRRTLLAVLLLSPSEPLLPPRRDTRKLAVRAASESRSRSGIASLAIAALASVLAKCR